MRAPHKTGEWQIVAPGYTVKRWAEEMAPLRIARVGKDEVNLVWDPVDASEEETYQIHVKRNNHWDRLTMMR